MNRRIVLLKPATTEQNSFGDGVTTDAQTEFAVWATWRELSGSERLANEVQYAIETVKVVTWYNAAYADISTAWHLRAEDGKEYDIEFVAEVGGRANRIEITATYSG